MDEGERRENETTQLATDSDNPAIAGAVRIGNGAGAMIPKTRKEMREKWVDAADAKLRADGIDRTDLVAVKKCLEACVGGHRLYQFWLEVFGDPPLE